MTRPAADMNGSADADANGGGQNRRFTLYIAGSAPSASSAVRNLSEILASAGLSMDAVRIVDVFREPGEALSAGLTVTPTLVATVSGHKQWFIGDFRRQDRLRAWIADMLLR